MGVHGLATYLREHQVQLAHTIQFPTETTRDGNTPIVVDGWSFIYELVHGEDIPWVYGGEYDRFTELVQRVVAKWIEVGLEVHFVFDGPYPELKFPTLISRVTQTRIQSALLFFRTSSVARAHPRFLRETAIMPPLTYSTCVAALRALASSSSALHIHLADREGDPHAVALAGRLGAYVTGGDSDFVVLNAEGYRGYIPLPEMVWTLALPAPTPDALSRAPSQMSAYSSAWSVDGEPGEEDGFVEVRKGKGRKRLQARADSTVVRGRGIVPPPEAFADTGGALTLSCTVYPPAALAEHLKIPASLLPLLGALVGNDFTAPRAEEDGTVRRTNLTHLFFERKSTLGERITRVARTLAGILAEAFGEPTPASKKKRGRRAIGSVLELIDAAVTALLVRPAETFASGEREAAVERIVEATLQYAVAKAEGEEGEQHAFASSVCPVHAKEACPLFGALSHGAGAEGDDVEADSREPDVHALVRDRYLAAYRSGQLSPHVLNPVHTSTMWPQLFLEDPDKETVLRSVARPVREWTYAVLDAGIGLPEQPQPQEEPDTEDATLPEDSDSEDENELVDVVEEDSDEDADPLENLRGRLKRLDDPSGATGQPPAQATPPAAALLPKTVAEYVRRGTRLVPEEVLVPSLTERLRALHWELEDQRPPQLWPDTARRTLLLRALCSDFPSVHALPDDRLLPVLSVRWVAVRMLARAAGGPASSKEMWTRAEVRAFLAAFSVEEEDEEAAVPVVERHVQLAAQVLSAADAIEHFAHALLLAPVFGSPMARFSGRRFHGLLAGTFKASEGVPGEGDLAACWEGLEDAYAAIPTKKGRKEKKAAGVSAVAAGKGAKKGSMYDLLGDVEA